MQRAPTAPPRSLPAPAGGQLPWEWGGLRQLAELFLGGNQLRGGLPQAWGSMQSLEKLDLGSNGLGEPWHRGLCIAPYKGQCSGVAALPAGPGVQRPGWVRPSVMVLPARHRPSLPAAADGCLALALPTARAVSHRSARSQRDSSLRSGAL